MFARETFQPIVLSCCLVAALVGECRLAVGGEAQDDPNLDILRSAKLPTDGPGLLKVLESWTGDDQDCVHLDDLIQQLGDASFAKRNEASRRIVALRHAALAQLERCQASKDAEIQARAKDCLKKIHSQYRYGIPMTVVRVLGRLKPEGTAEALVRYLPFIAEEEVQEEIWFTVYGLVKERPGALLPVMEKALQDPLPARRALAGCVVGRLGNKQQQAAVAKLLEDRDPQVRLRAAQGLLAGKNPAGVPTLIKLLEEPGVEISWSAEELLHYLAGDDAPEQKVGASDEKSRLASQTAWDKWWQSRQRRINFTEIDTAQRRPALYLVIAPEHNPPRIGIDDNPAGLSVPRPKRTEHSKGLIALYGCDGKLRWKLRDWLNDAQLLGNNRLLVVGHCPSPGIPISERDLTGKVLWNPRIDELFAGKDDDATPIPKTLDSSFVSSCRRLASGNTFVALFGGDSFEIDRAGRVAHRIKLSSFAAPSKASERFSCLRLLSNGRLLAEPRFPTKVILELEFETGKELRRQSLGHGLNGLLVSDVLPNGNYVIWMTDQSKSSLQEIDSAGHTVGPPGAHRGIRLRNNNTIVATFLRSFPRITEFSSDGRALWQAICELDPNQHLRLRHAHECLGLVRLGFDAPWPLKFDVSTSLSYLLNRLRSKDERVRACARYDLTMLGEKATSAIPMLNALLDDSEVASAAWSVLKEIGPEAFPVILNVAKYHKNVQMRGDALRELSRFTDKTAMLMPIWLELANDRDLTIRQAAVGALAESMGRRLVQGQAIPANERRDIIRVVAAALSDPVLAEQACSDLGGLGPDAIPELIKVVKSDSMTMRIIAVHALRRQGPAASGTIPELLHAFQTKKDEDKLAVKRLRWNIVDAFRLMGVKGKAAVPLLTLLLADKTHDMELRCLAASALAEIGERTTATENALLSAANDENEHLRVAAIRALELLRSRTNGH